MSTFSRSLNRYNVLWATFDGQLMSLWKKRTVSLSRRPPVPPPPVSVSPFDSMVCFLYQDRFSELLFHVSSITNVKKQEKGRFSVYFRKKHYDFMAQSDGTS